MVNKRAGFLVALHMLLLVVVRCNMRPNVNGATANLSHATAGHRMHFSTVLALLSRLLPGFHLIPSHSRRSSFHLASSRSETEGGPLEGWDFYHPAPSLGARGQPWGPCPSCLAKVGGPPGVPQTGLQENWGRGHHFIKCVLLCSHTCSAHEWCRV